MSATPFDNIASLKPIVLASSFSIQDLLKLRRVSRTFDDTITNYLAERWMWIIDESDVYYAFTRSKLYVLERIFQGRAYSQTIPPPYGNDVFQLRCFVAIFDYPKYLAERSDESVIRLSTQYLDINKICVCRANGAGSRTSALGITLCNEDMRRFRLLLDNGADPNTRVITETYEQSLAGYCLHIGTTAYPYLRLLTERLTTFRGENDYVPIRFARYIRHSRTPENLSILHLMLTKDIDLSARDGSATIFMQVVDITTLRILIQKARDTGADLHAIVNYRSRVLDRNEGTALNCLMTYALYEARMSRMVGEDLENYLLVLRTLLEIGATPDEEHVRHFRERCLSEELLRATMTAIEESPPAVAPAQSARDLQSLRLRAGGHGA